MKEERSEKVLSWDCGQRSTPESFQRLCEKHAVLVESHDLTVRKMVIG